MPVVPPVLLPAVLMRMVVLPLVPVLPPALLAVLPELLVVLPAPL